ncbi:unnamed protein product, partial [Cyprideis torosa]
MMGMSQLLLSVVAGIFLVLDPSAGQTYTTLANQMADSALEQISCELKKNGFDPINITFAPVTQSVAYKIPPFGPTITVTATLLLTGVVTGLSNVARNGDAELTVGVTSALKLPIQIAPVAIDVTGTLSFSNPLSSLNRQADIAVAVPPIQMEINAGMDFSSNTISFSHVISPIDI